MIADKTIEILEELKGDVENKCHSSTDASNIEALASENDELKRQLAELDKHIEKAKKEISLINEHWSNARFENQNLKVQCDTYEKCLSLIMREAGHE